MPLARRTQMMDHKINFKNEIMNFSLSIGLVAQSVEQQTINSGGCGFDSRRDRTFFSLPRAISHFLIQWGNDGNFMGSQS